MARVAERGGARFVSVSSLSCVRLDTCCYDSYVRIRSRLRAHTQPTVESRKRCPHDAHRTLRRGSFRLAGRPCVCRVTWPS